MRNDSDTFESTTLFFEASHHPLGRPRFKILPSTKGVVLQAKKNQKLFNVTVEFADGRTKLVKVKASDFSTAQRRALKFNPLAKRVRHDDQ